MKALSKWNLVVLFLFVSLGTSFGMISVGTLTKEQAKERGITMKARKNGDAGVKVWVEFKKVGVYKDFSYAQLKMTDDKGQHLLSAMLHPHPVVHGQDPEIFTVSFSGAPEQLLRCSIMLVAYMSIEGDVGYVLKVADFLSPEQLAELAKRK